MLKLLSEEQATVEACASAASPTSTPCPFQWLCNVFAWLVPATFPRIPFTPVFLLGGGGGEAQGIISFENWKNTSQCRLHSMWTPSWTDSSQEYKAAVGYATILPSPGLCYNFSGLCIRDRFVKQHGTRALASADTSLPRFEQIKKRIWPIGVPACSHELSADGLHSSISRGVGLVETLANSLNCVTNNLYMH